MAIWAKVDVDMPGDGKLFGQPLATRHLWTSLICLSRKQDDHGAIRGYDCALLSRAFNIPRTAVAAALTYFQAIHFVELDPDGTIRVLKYGKWYGEKTLADQRAEWCARQTKKRGSVTRDNSVTPTVTQGRDISVTHASSSSSGSSSSEVKQEKTKLKQKPSATLATLPSAAEGKTVQTRLAYESAFRERWGADPLTGKAINGQLARFLGVVGAEAAPAVAAFYVRHNQALYVNAKHPVNLLLRDAQKLHTEWSTGCAMTGTEARQIEKTQANVDGWASMLKEKPA